MAFCVNWLGQGGFMVTLGDARVCIDPYLSDSVARSSDRFKRLVTAPVSPGELDCDLIIATHDHLDHLDPDTIGATDFFRLLYAGPRECEAHFRELGIPAANVRRFGLGDVIDVKDARLMGVFAKHTQDSIGVVIEYRGVKLYFTGDTLYHEQLGEVGVLGIDIMYTCINGKLGNMDALDAARLARQVGCRAAIPVHFGMFAENTCDPEGFVEAMRGSGVYVEVPKLGEERSVYALLEAAEG